MSTTMRKAERAPGSTSGSVLSQAAGSVSGESERREQSGAADLTVYYNGGCPICSAEIDHYRRRAEASGEAIAWVDVAGDHRAESDTGLDQKSLKRRLYARLPDGRLVGGVDAFEAVWDRVPGFARLSRLLRWGPARATADAVYERLLAPGLVAFNEWRDRRKASER